MNIVLCGMMGVGKTSVGMRMAEMCGRHWVDTDDVITARFGRISDIFEYYGEEYFRDIESEVISEASSEEDVIISVGGGGVLRTENVRTLKEHNCKIVFLRAGEDALLERLSGSDGERPLLMKRSEAQTRRRIKELLDERGIIYEHVADEIINTDGKTLDEVAGEVLKLL